MMYLFLQTNSFPYPHAIREVEMTNVLFNTSLILFLFNTILLFILIFFMYLYFKKRRRSNELLYKKLKHIELLKNDFLTNISNELKTPLQSINNITDSLLSGAVGQLTSYQKYNLSIIGRNSKDLFNKIINVLDLTKLKNKEISLNKKYVDMKSLTDTVISLTKELVEEKDIKIINNISSNINYIYGDEYRLEQVMYQLISNAIKFTNTGEITISSVRKRNVVQFCVKDTGIGIPETKLNNIFKTFQQINKNISIGYGGTGIGLSIAKEIIKLHKGDIKVESKLDKGSNFIFTLPLSSNYLIPDKSEYNLIKNDITYNISAENKNHKQLKPYNELTEIKDNISELKYKTKILVVDDDESNRLIIKNYLDVKDYYIIEAENGEKALEIISDKTLKPDLIIVDTIIPQISGYDLCEKIRKEYNSFELPILLLVDKTRLIELVAGLKTGANDYLTIPFDKSEIYARVTNLLKLKTSLAKYYELNETLEQKVIERTGELNKAKEALELEIYKRKKKEEQLETEINRRKVLNRIISYGNKSSDLKTTLDKIANIIRIYTKFDVITIYLCEENNNTAKLFSLKGTDYELFKNVLHINVNSYKKQSVSLLEGELITIKDHNLTLPEFRNIGNLKASFSVPIYSNVRIIGNINAFQKKSYNFSQSEIELFQDIGKELGNVISKIKTEKELKQSQERYKAIVEHQPEFICRFSPNFILSFVNKSFCKYFKKDKETFINKTNFYDIILEEDRNTVIEALKSLNFKSQIYITEFRIKKDNKIKWHRWYYQAIFDKNKSLVEYQATGTDITTKKETEQRLKERETKYRLLFKQMIAGFEYCKIITDEENNPIDFEFIEVNKTFADFLNLKVENFIGKRFKELANREELESFDWIKTYGDVALNNKEIYFDVEYPRGSERWYSVFAYSTQKNYFAAIAQDITEKKKAEQKIKASEEKFRTIFETSTTGLILIDKNKNTIDMNNSALSIFGIKNKKHLIEYSLFFIGKDINIKNKGNLDDIINYENYEHIVDLRLIRPQLKDDKLEKKEDIIYIEVSFTPVSTKNDEIISYLIQIQDITNNKRIVENLSRQAKELTRLNDNLKTFTTAVSHDLKSPLISVDGYIQTILSEYENKVEKGLKNSLLEIKESVNEMFQIITNILNLATISDKKMNYDKVNLSSLAADVIQKIKNNEKIKDKHLIIINPNLTAYGDEGLIRIMLDNLFRNAWKFTKHKEKPKIKFSVKNKNDSQIFYIRDNGIGFNQEDSKYIFKKFRKLHSSEKYEGRGIGLSIVKKVIDKHKGKIWAKAKKNKGAIFYFTFNEE